MKKILLICLTALFALMLAACETDGEATPATSNSITSGNEETPEPMPSENTETLGIPTLENAEKVKKGMSKNEVIEILGEQETSEYDIAWGEYSYKRWDLFSSSYAFISFKDSAVEIISIHPKQKYYDIECAEEIPIGMSDHELSHHVGECIYSFVALDGKHGRLFVLEMPEKDYLVVSLNSEQKVEKKLQRNCKDRITEGDVERIKKGMSFKEMYEAFGKPYYADDYYWVWETDIVEYAWEYGTIYKKLYVIESEVSGSRETETVFIGYESELLSFDEAVELLKGIYLGTVKMSDIVEKTGYSGIYTSSGNHEYFKWLINDGCYLVVNRHFGTIQCYIVAKK